jgi:hypothetical protein
MLQVYEERTVSTTWVCAWVKRFQDRRKDIKDNKRAGHPETSRSFPNV